MPNSTLDLATSYLAAWQQKDIASIAQHLDADVRFIGPMMEVQGRDRVVAATQRILPLLHQFIVRSVFVSENRAMFAYDFVCAPPIGICRTAEMIACKNGLIEAIELFYDARPFEQLARAGAGSHAASP